MVEDDDDAIDIVTYDEVEADTPFGRVTKRIQVPLRPNATVQESIPHLGPSYKTTSTTDDRYHEPVGDGMNWQDNNDEISGETQRNTVKCPSFSKT